MASPPGNTSSYQKTELIPSEQQKQLFAFQYGAPNAPGRIMLREASRLGKIYENYNRGKPGSVEEYWGYTPSAQEILAHNPDAGKINPGLYAEAAKKAATGGLMTLRGYAEGGKALTSEQAKFVQDASAKAAKGTALSQAEIDRLNKIETNTGRNVSPYTDTGTITPGNSAVANAATSLQKSYTTQQDSKKTEGSGYTLKQATERAMPGFDVAALDPVTGKNVPYMGITNPYGQAALDAVTNAKMPTEYGAASQMYQQAGAGLAGLAGFTPSQVSAGNATAGTSAAGRGSAQQATAAQMGNVADISAPEMQYFQADRGGIRDVEAAKAEAYGYDPTKAEASSYAASGMNAPQGIEALAYDAAQMQAAQMNRADVRDINAQLADVERYNASLMNAPQDIQAQAYQAEQARLNQMRGPSSWTEAGTAEKYMNPYIQNVVDIQKREANRDYQKQLNELNKQAVGAKAYGGSRLAIERAEAARNQATKLADIEAEGLNQAYQQGMGQFTTEQGQGLQAGQANLSAAQQTALANQQALNSQRSQFVAQALEAAKNNYGGQLTAAQQNQIAQNAAAQFNAQSQNTAYNNYVAQQLAAQQANQQMDFGVGQLNTQNQQAANAANQAAINAQRSQYVTQALEAAKNNYAGELTAEQQNMIANNAASQFNAQANMQTSQYNANAANTAAQYYATAQNQAEKDYYAQQFAAAQLNQGMDYNTVMANLQANLGVQNTQVGAIMQAAMSNQQTQFGVGSLNANLANQTAIQNAQLGTQASLQNAQLQTQTGIANAANQTQTSLANQQANLNAQIANQNAGISGAQIGVGAYGAMGNMASGLGSIGNNIANWNQQQTTNLAQAFNTTQGFADTKAEQFQGNAAAQQFGGINATSGAIKTAQGTPTTGAGAGQTSGVLN